MNTNSNTIDQTELTTMLNFLYSNNKVDLLKQIFDDNKNNIIKENGKINCDICHKYISKKNIQKHYKTEKHILKKKLV